MTSFLALPGQDDADNFVMLRGVAEPSTDRPVAMVVALMDFSDLLEAHIPSSVRPYVDWDAKDRFIASVSHELRTPLTAVLGFAEILRDGEELSPEARVAIMKAITEEATDLVRSRCAMGWVSRRHSPIGFLSHTNIPTQLPV